MVDVEAKAEEVVRRSLRIPASIICILTLVFQAYVTNRYLVTHYDRMWWLWWLADIAVVALFIAAFVVCGLHLMRPKNTKLKCMKVFGGKLPLGYISWFVYSVFLATRVAIIFMRFAYALREADFFGPNMLKTNIALTSIVFFNIVLTHSDTKPDSPRDAYVTLVIGRVCMDLLDTVSLLEVLFIEESRVILSFEIQKAIVGVACINLILPTVPLAVLSYTHFGKKEMPKILDTLHISLYLLFVNVPMLVLRLLLWHVHSENISVFIIKNILSLGMTIKKIHDHIAEIYKDVEEKKNEVEMDTLKNNQHDEPTTELSEGQARSVFI